MEERIAAIDDREIGPSDDDAVLGRDDLDGALAERIRDFADGLALRDPVAGEGRGPEQSAFRCPEPRARCRDRRRHLAARDTGGRDHAEPLHHPQYADDPGPHGDLVEAKGLAAFIEEDLYAAVARALPKRALAQFRNED